MTIDHTVASFVKGMNEFAEAEYNWLRDAQRDILFDDTCEHFDSGEDCGTFDVLTGAGKTVMFSAFIKSKMLADYPELHATDKRAQITPEMVGEEPKKGTLILCPTQLLVDQTILSLANFLPEYVPLTEAGAARKQSGEELTLDDIDWERSIIGGLHNELQRGGKPIMVSTYQSLVADMRNAKKEKRPREFSPDRFDLVLGDEAHKSLGKETSKALREFHDEAVRIGFSATTDYSETRTVHNEWGPEITKLGVLEGQDLGLIVPWFKTILVQTGLDIKIEDSDYQGRERFSSNYYRKLNSTARNMCAIAKYMNFADPDTGERLFGQTGIITCGSMDQAKTFSDLANKRIRENPDFASWLTEEARIRAEACTDPILKDRFQKEGIRICESITSKTPKEERARILADHKAGKTLLLSGVRIPAEGYDNPRASFIFCLAPTLSKVKKMQEGGRVLRLDPANPEKIPYIFEFIDKEEYRVMAGTLLAPILYPETLGPDFQHRKPPSFENKNRGGHKPAPAIDINIDDISNIVSDISEVRNFIAERTEKRREGERREIPKAFEGWTNVREMLLNAGLRDSGSNIDVVHNEITIMEQGALRMFRHKDENQPNSGLAAITSDIKYHIGGRIKSRLVDPDYADDLMQQILKNRTKDLTGNEILPFPEKYEATHMGARDIGKEIFEGKTHIGTEIAISGATYDKLIAPKLEKIVERAGIAVQEGKSMDLPQPDGSLKTVPLSDFIIGPYIKQGRRQYFVHRDYAASLAMTVPLAPPLDKEKYKDFIQIPHVLKLHYDLPVLHRKNKDADKRRLKEIEEKIQLKLEEEMARDPNQRIPLITPTGYQLSEKPLCELMVGPFCEHSYEGYFLASQVAEWAIRSTGLTPKLRHDFPDSFITESKFVKGYAVEPARLHDYLSNRADEIYPLKEGETATISPAFHYTHRDKDRIEKDETTHLLHTSEISRICKDLDVYPHMPPQTSSSCRPRTVAVSLGLIDSDFNCKLINEALEKYKATVSDMQVSGPYMTKEGKLEHVLELYHGERNTMRNILLLANPDIARLTPFAQSHWGDVKHLGTKEDVIQQVEGLIASKALPGQLSDYIGGPYLEESGEVIRINPIAASKLNGRAEKPHANISQTGNWCSLRDMMISIDAYCWEKCDYYHLTDTLVDLAQNHAEVKIPVLTNYHDRLSDRDLKYFTDRMTTHEAVGAMIYIPETSEPNENNIKVDPRLLSLVCGMTDKPVPAKYSGILPDGNACTEWLTPNKAAEATGMDRDELNTQLTTGYYEKAHVETEGKKYPVSTLRMVFKSGFTTDKKIHPAAVEYVRKAKEAAHSTDIADPEAMDVTHSREQGIE